MNENSDKNIRAIGCFIMFIVLLIIGLCYWGCHKQQEQEKIAQAAQYQRNAHEAEIQRLEREDRARKEQFDKIRRGGK